LESAFALSTHVHVKRQLKPTSDKASGSYEGGGRSMDTRSLGWLTIPVALTLLSCGDAVPPPAEGAASITIQNSTATVGSGYGCKASHTVLWGDLAPGPSSEGSVWVDGQSGHSVSCSVSGSGTYNFSGTIYGGSNRFTISGTAQAGATTNGARVQVYDTTMGGVSVSDSNCTVTLDGQYKVEKGAIYAALSCTNLRSGEDMYLVCGATGTFIFKSCS
jgi:hypothetical protein